MTSSPLLLFAMCAASASLAMALTWALQVRIGDARHVDVARALPTGANQREVSVFVPRPPRRSS